MVVIRNVLSRNGTPTSTGRVFNGRAGVTLGHRQIGILQPRKGFLFRVATLNAGTMKGRCHEIVETMSRRSIDLCCVQETRSRGVSATMISGKDSR